MKSGALLVGNAAEADDLAGQVRASATKLRAWIASFGGEGIAHGVHAAQPLDVMSEVEGLVGAETFAAVDPRNNRKLAKDLDKLAQRPELHRYVFFAFPMFPGTTRLPKLERGGVQVWSVDV